VTVSDSGLEAGRATARQGGERGQDDANDVATFARLLSIGRRLGSRASTGKSSFGDSPVAPLPIHQAALNTTVVCPSSSIAI